MIGKIINLRGKSQKGKNRVHENGDVWEVVAIADSIACGKRSGPWLLLQAMEPTTKDFPDQRWIQQTDDLDFEIMEVTE